MKPGKRFVLVAGFAALAGLTWYLNTILSPQQIQSALEGVGIWAPLAYIGLFVVLPAFFFPVAVLALAGDCCSDCGRGRCTPSPARF